MARSLPSTRVASYLNSDKMKTLLAVVASILCVQARAAILLDASSITPTTTVDDWSALHFADGDDGPVYYQSLRIESLNNSSDYNEIGHYSAAPSTGFPDDADGGVSALNASITRTDFLFTFPSEVTRAGLYVRGFGTFLIFALDADRTVLDYSGVGPGFPPGMFRGFADLSGFRSIRVIEVADDSYSSQFDEIQWQVPEPATMPLLTAVAIAATRTLVRTRGLFLGRQTISPVGPRHGPVR